MNKIIKPDPETWLKKFKFKTPIRVRFCETDAFGHVNNVSFLIYFEQARVDYIKALNLEEEFLSGKESYIVAADIYCQYLQEVGNGEELESMARTSKIGNSSFDLEYAIVRAGTQNIVAAGRGALVFLNRNTQKSIRIPENIREKITHYEGL